ncbi:MAG: mechanosensitive ion channel family protein, partial [Clostridiales bacterium]|nr:mechanosensitive ion channel family protein [Clostridiales bacterium]
EYKDDIVQKPEVLGVKALNVYGTTITISGKAKPLSQWKLERALRKQLKVTLYENNIKMPYPKTQIIN